MIDRIKVGKKLSDLTTLNSPNFIECPRSDKAKQTIHTKFGSRS